MSSDALLSSTKAPSHSIIHMHWSTRGVRVDGTHRRRSSSQPTTPAARSAGCRTWGSSSARPRKFHEPRSMPARTFHRRRTTRTTRTRSRKDGDVAARLQRSRRALARPGAHWTRTRRRWMWRRRNSVPARAGAPAAAFAPAKAQASSSGEVISWVVLVRWRRKNGK